MNIVIPIRKDTKNNHIELIYAIRSLQKHLKGMGDIFIVGDKINQLQGLKYISCKDDKQSKFKERNIYRKIIAACEHPDVGEDFIFTNDDIFLTEDFDVNNLPFYHKGELETTMAKNTGDYRKSLNHSRKFLLQNGYPTLDFDTHFPIVYNKKKYFDTFVYNNLNWEQPFGYVIKSLYCNFNFNGIVGEYGGDCKIQHKMSYEEIKAKIEAKKFFSTSDGCINEPMLKILNELYPEPSKYEK